MCVNEHDPDQMIERDGRRICLACRDMYNRRTRVQGYRVAPTPRKANHHADATT